MSFILPYSGSDWGREQKALSAAGACVDGSRLPPGQAGDESAAIGCYECSK
jgi:hypothetical protein